jgi:hypothetical protein
MLYLGITLATKAQGLIRTLSRFRHFACRERRAGREFSLFCRRTYTTRTAQQQSEAAKSERVRVYLCVQVQIQESGAHRVSSYERT